VFASVHPLAAEGFVVQRTNEPSLAMPPATRKKCETHSDNKGKGSSLQVTLPLPVVNISIGVGQNSHARSLVFLPGSAEEISVRVVQFSLKCEGASSATRAERVL
jgi:hypothetical protein